MHQWSANSGRACRAEGEQPGPNGGARVVPYSIKDAVLPARSAVLALYEAVGWDAYTREPEVLMRALAGSHRLITASAGAQLVGLARAVSDGATICYVQDVLIHPQHQRRGLGRALLQRLLAHYSHLRQRVLLTDAAAAQHAFYTDCGFTESREHPAGPLHAFVQIGMG